MAYRVRPFYNTEGPVGKGRGRRVDDIMLVQLLLNEFMLHPGLLNPVKPTRPLAINGTDDSILEEWILSFQTAYRDGINRGFLVDGIIDTVPGYATQQTTRTHTTYSLALLNNNYESFNQGLFSHIWDDPRCPKALKDSLLVNSR